MSERRYTIAEIDRIRAGIRARLHAPMVVYEGLIGAPVILTQQSQGALADHERRIEDQVRTALIAGIDPNEFPELTSQET